ncbi:unnamed protein product [Staurois parvus]|uniref:Uncharacterized protein n=1 Tax=Staurois parvus TaxID=386267 RepID=A0ABN9EQ67_9NEOB|nr:unnamed protein product [Staurois parvus]
MGTAAGVYVKLTTPRNRSAKRSAMCRIGSHRCEYPCDPILVRTQKRVMHLFDTVRLEPYKMYDSNRTAHKSHLICRGTRCGSYPNHMRYTALH